ICAKESTHQLEEMADMLEVMHAILKTKEMSFADLEAIRLQKHLEKGGFDKGFFLEKTSQQIPEQDSLPCLFCLISRQEINIEVIAKFHHCFVIEDKFPVSRGHLLIIPYEHFNHWFEAPEIVLSDILTTLKLMKSWLDSEYHPDGYNIGMNCGEAAG